MTVSDTPKKSALPCQFFVDRVLGDPRPCYFSWTVEPKIHTVSAKSDRVMDCDNFSRGGSWCAEQMSDDQELLLVVFFIS